MSVAQNDAERATGVVFIHSSPSAVCPHVEWSLSAALGARPGLRWTAQPSAPGQLRATVSWVGPVGTAAVLTKALRAWPVLRFEVTEDPSAGVDGERFSHVPELGTWRGSTSANGDVVLGEQRLRAMLAAGTLAADLHDALGTDWDHALEPFRTGGTGGEVTWLHRRVS